MSAGSGTALRTDADVLGDEVLCGEVLHVIGCEFVALLLLTHILLLLNYLFKLVADKIRNVLESLRHARLVLIGHAHARAKLRVKLAGDLGRPVRNLIANKVNVLLTIIDDLVIFLVLCNFIEQLNNLLAVLGHGEALAGIGVLLLAVIVNLQNMKNLLLLVILLPQIIQFLFIFADCAEELRVRLFPREEFVDHLLNITIACRSSDLLECILQMTILVHFVFHFLLQELTPKLLNLEVSTSSAEGRFGGA